MDPIRIAILRDRIVEEAIKWSDERILEFSKDERLPKRESNFAHRVNQGNSLQSIMDLVAELHKETEE